VRIDRSRLIAAMFDHPEVAVAVWWNALQREAILRERITAIGRRSAYARVAHLLCEISQRGSEAVTKTDDTRQNQGRTVLPGMLSERICQIQPGRETLSARDHHPLGAPASGPSKLLKEVWPA
jgi:hypothetical protein